MSNSKVTRYGAAWNTLAGTPPGAFLRCTLKYADGAMDRRLHHLVGIRITNRPRPVARDVPYHIDVALADSTPERTWMAVARLLRENVQIVDNVVVHGQLGLTVAVLEGTWKPTVEKCAWDGSSEGAELYYLALSYLGQVLEANC